ncbi:MAG TPA: flagellar basal body protein FliL [Treponema sp.]|nr:flagellar basal body protein FliL [Treponema sp.]
MKRIVRSSSHKLLTVYRIEFVLLLILVTIILVGSFYAILRPADSKPVLTFGGTDDNAPRGEALRENNAGIFSGINRLRIPLAGQGGSAGGTMVLSIAFPYPLDDRPFTEELASKITDFKTIAADYFSSLPADSITNLDEDAAKSEILKRYNEVLRLGKIEALYFSDLMIIE